MRSAAGRRPCAARARQAAGRAKPWRRGCAGGAGEPGAHMGKAGRGGKSRWREKEVWHLAHAGQRQGGNRRDCGGAERPQEGPVAGTHMLHATGDRSSRSGCDSRGPNAPLLDAGAGHGTLSAAIRHHAHPRVRGWSQGGRPSARGKPAKGGIWRQPGAPAGWQAHGAWGRERGQPGCHSNGTKTCMHAHMGARAGPGMLPAAAFLARCKARCRGCPRGSSTMLGRGVRVEGGPVRPARRRPWSDRCRASAQLSAGCAAMLRRESRPW